MIVLEASHSRDRGKAQHAGRSGEDRGAPRQQILKCVMYIYIYIYIYI